MLTCLFCRRDITFAVIMKELEDFLPVTFSFFIEMFFLSISLIHCFFFIFPFLSTINMYLLNATSVLLVIVFP